MVDDCYLHWGEIAGFLRRLTAFWIVEVVFYGSTNYRRRVLLLFVFLKQLGEIWPEHNPDDLSKFSLNLFLFGVVKDALHFVHGIALEHRRKVQDLIPRSEELNTVLVVFQQPCDAW